VYLQNEISCVTPHDAAQREPSNDNEVSALQSASDGVLVLMATFNGARYLGEQLESIALQSHKNWNLLVCDDGSLDDSLDVIRTFQQRYPEKVRVVEMKPVESARDNFFRLLLIDDSSPYVALCDQDDVWSVNKLESLVRACQDLEAAHQMKPCLVFSDLEVVDADLVVLNPSFMDQIRAQPRKLTYKSLLIENAIPGCAMLFNKALADIVRERSFDSGRTIMHDWWISLVAATLGQISFVALPLVQYRQHTNNTLGTVNRSGPRFMLSKLIAWRRSPTTQAYDQGAAFLNRYGDLLKSDVRMNISVFATLGQSNKTARIRSLVRHRLLKQTFSRRIYQLLRA
jgi:glycosyltransferase involved in cell wall biosynthesis